MLDNKIIIKNNNNNLKFFFNKNKFIHNSKSDNIQNIKNQITNQDYIDDDNSNNRIFISASINGLENRRSLCYLSQKNLKHNMIFNNKEKKIYFTSYFNSFNGKIETSPDFSYNNNHFLFDINKDDSSENYEINKILFDNNFNHTFGKDDYLNITIKYNFYDISYNYIQFKLNDFLDDTTYTASTFNNIDISNDDYISKINLKKLNKLHYVDASNKIKQITNSNAPIEISNNKDIYLYNTLDSIFLRQLDFSYNNNGSDANNLKIYGFVYSPPNISIFENTEQYSNKLYLTNNLIYLNAKVFPSDISINDNIYLKNNNKKIFLSLSDSNNCCTGLTHNLLNNDIIKLKNNNNNGSFDINKIYINKQTSYKTYSNSRLENYFIHDISYDYDYDCTHINSYRLDRVNVKEFTINLDDELNKIINNSFNNNKFYDFSNIFSENINEFLYLNGRNNSIINDIYYLGIDKFNDVSDNIKFQINDLSYYYTNRISNPTIEIKYGSSYHKLETLDSNLAILYDISFDKQFGSKFKFNYNNDIIIDSNLYIIYDNGELNDLSYNFNDKIGFILNNDLDFKITFFITPGDSDIFEEVDCVYIWNKKEDKYRYPNNNIDICMLLVSLYSVWTIYSKQKEPATSQSLLFHIPKSSLNSVSQICFKNNKQKP